MHADRPTFTFLEFRTTRVKTGMIHSGDAREYEAGRIHAGKAGKLLDSVSRIQSCHGVTGSQQVLGRFLGFTRSAYPPVITGKVNGGVAVSRLLAAGATLGG